MQKKDVSNITELLKTTKLLSSLTPDELEPIVNKIRIKHAKKKQTLIHQEEFNNNLYIILSGKVKITIMNEDGREVTIAIRQAGEFFGEMSLINNEITCASVITIEDSIVATLLKEDFWSLVYSHKKFVTNLLHSLCSRLRENNSIIERLTYNKAQQRLGYLFLVFAKNYGEKTEDGVTLNIQLTHQDIADLTGLLRETVTKVLEEFREQGYLKQLKNKIYQLTPSFFNNI